jgi:hypothetical protein
MTNKPELTIFLLGGCAIPLSEIAENIRSFLQSQGFIVVIEESATTTDEWCEGYDSCTEDETILIRHDPCRDSKFETP